jgi:hypothetical protein
MAGLVTFFKDTLKKTSFYILSDQFKHIGKGTIIITFTRAKIYFNSE